MAWRSGPDAPVLVVAGPTGAGKGVLCRWLAERGAFVLEADRVGHELLLDEAVVGVLVGAFGEGIRGAGGAIDRPSLGRAAFSDEASRRRLNRIVHPPLVAEIRRRIDHLRRSRGTQLIVVDAALHYEFEPPVPADAVLWATAPRGLRRERIMGRDGIDGAAADARLERQAGLDELGRSRADAVLETDRPRTALRDELLATVDRLLGADLVDSDPAGLRERAAADDA